MKNVEEQQPQGSGSGDGILVSHFGVAVEVLFPGPERKTVRVKRNSGHVVGDEVCVDGETLIRRPRRTELRRRDARGGMHLVAANLDVLGIVVAPFSPHGFIDRAVVAARAAGLDPFVVSNKCDLEEGVQHAASVCETYGEAVSVFPLSVRTGEGLESLRTFISKGHRVAFVGSTGVGKSSLLNLLCPGVDLKVGSVSDYKRLGRHTTTVATLHLLPGGGEVVDTPGFRDFGLVDISGEELARYFPGLEGDGVRQCRFHDCRHRSEPGCTVRDRVAAGELSSARYQVYLSVLEEVERVEGELRRPRKTKN